MNSPFKRFSDTTLKQAKIIFIIFTFASFLLLNFIDSYLINDVCTDGIISFQFSKDLFTAQEILNSWNSTAKIAAGISLGFDYFYLLFYGLLIALLIHNLNEALWKGKRLFKLGVFIIYFPLLAAVFDAIENIGSINLLLGNESQFWTSISYYFAFAKFSLLAISVFYIIINYTLLKSNFLNK